MLPVEVRALTKLKGVLGRVSGYASSTSPRQTSRKIEASSTTSERLKGIAPDSGSKLINQNGLDYVTFYW